MYSSISLTSTLNVVGCQRHVPVALPPGERTGTDCTGDWVGCSTGLDGGNYWGLCTRTVQLAASRYTD